MKRFLTIATIVASLSITAHAQKSIINGYIVQLNGDTTKGYIDYKNWNKNPSAINFYKQKPGEKQVFNPNSIKAFGVNDGKYADDYVAQTIEIENSIQNLDRLNNNPNPIFIKKTVFLQKIVSGFASLLKFTDSTDRSHYFISKNNVYEELIYKKYYAKSRQIAYNENYKNQLIKVLSDCVNTLNEKIDQVNYREQELVKLILIYNNCISPGVVNTVRNTQKVRVNFGVLAGIDYSNLNFKYLNHVNFDPSINVAAGLSMLFIIPRSSEKIGIYIDFLYRHINFNKDYTTTTSANQYTTDHFRYNGNYIKLNSLFRYTFSQFKTKPFLNLGISNAMAFNEIENSSQTNVFYTKNETKSNNLFDGARRHEQGLVFGIGTTYKKLGLELRGEASNGFSPYAVIKTVLHTGYLLLHYQL